MPGDGNKRKREIVQEFCAISDRARGTGRGDIVEGTWTRHEWIKHSGRGRRSRVSIRQLCFIVEKFRHYLHCNFDVSDEQNWPTQAECYEIEGVLADIIPSGDEDNVGWVGFYYADRDRLAKAHLQLCLMDDMLSHAQDVHDAALRYVRRRVKDDSADASSDVDSER